MKKLLALLLALVVVGGAFAQVTTAVSLSGGLKLVDQDQMAKFERDGDGYDLLTLKASDADGKFGFALTDQNVLDDTTIVVRDWNAWFKGKYTKVIVGNLRNGDFRMLLPKGYVSNFGATARVSGYGALIESTTLGALTLGVNLPIPTAGVNSVDMLKSTDIGAAYTIDKVGKAILLANLDLVANSNVVNFGFNFTGVENLSAVAIYQGTFATASTHKFGLGGLYTMDKLWVALEGSGAYTTALAWDLKTKVNYNITDALYVAVKGSFDSTDAYYAKGYVGYDYGNGLSSEIMAGYDSAAQLVYDIYLYYSVAF